MVACDQRHHLDLLRVEARAVQLIRDFHEAGKPIAAICHAPWVLVEAGIVVSLGHSDGSYVQGVAALEAGALLASKLMQRTGVSRSTSTVRESIDLNVPVSTAYNQWTQFEEFPRFMASVDEVKQLDDTHLHWRAVVAGKEKEWDAEITEQVPDQRIAWRSTKISAAYCA